MKIRVLFICSHNSARSQIAEALMNKTCGEVFEAHSAGLAPGELNPMAIDVLKEIGIDISHKKPQAVFDVFKAGQLFPYVITVCSESEAQGCPIFPGVTTRLHWPFPDPSSFKGPYPERLERTREVRDMIQDEIDRFCEEKCRSAAELTKSDSKEP